MTNDTVAAGMILGPARSLRSVASGERSQVSDAERSDRLGHRGAAIRVVEATLEEARAAAFALERDLFDARHLAAVVDRLDIAQACARAGVVAIVAENDPDERIEIDGARLASADPKDVLRALS